MKEKFKYEKFLKKFNFPKKNILSKRFNSLKELDFSRKLLLILGVLLIIIGIILTLLSFIHEVLDDKYIIKDVTENISKDIKSLSKGEMIASKSTEYMKEGIYKITYINYAKKLGNKNLIDGGSYFNITDMLGSGYELIPNKININDKNYKLKDNTISSEKGINISYENNILSIDIPNSSLLKQNVIEVYIKLIGRDKNVEYVTSQDAYYSFIPSVENDFYNKKSSQAYVIDNFGYIKLDEK